MSSVNKAYKGFIDPAVEFLPAPLLALNIESNKEIKIIAKLTPPLEGRYAGKPKDPLFPFITERKLKKGMIYYIAGSFFEFYDTYAIVHYKNFIKKILDKHIKNEFQLINAPESLEITIRKNDLLGGIIIHRVNYSGGMSRPIDKVIPLQNLSLKLPSYILSVKSLQTKLQLEIKNETVELPTLNEFDVILCSM